MLLASSLYLAACGAGEDGFVEPTGNRLAKISAIVKAVNWSNAEERTVVLDEFNFTPANLTFKINQPYELTLSNEGGVGHKFVSSATNILRVVDGLCFAGGEVNLPLLGSVALETGESNILIFVPLTAGTFPLVCDQPLHETFGMEGMITIE